MPAAKKDAASPAPTLHVNLATALAAFQAEAPPVAKNHTADTGKFRYSYADLADTTDAILPVLTRHGLSFVCIPRQTPNGYELVGTMLHLSGEKLEGALPLHGRTPQEIGSSLTYMRRYLLCAMTGVVADDDDDGQRAQAAESRTQAEPQPEPVRPDQQALLDRLQAYDHLPKAQLLQTYATWKLPPPAQLAPNQVAWVMEQLDVFDQQQAGAQENPPV